MRTRGGREQGRLARTGPRIRFGKRRFASSLPFCQFKDRRRAQNRRAVLAPPRRGVENRVPDTVCPARSAHANLVPKQAGARALLCRARGATCWRARACRGGQPYQQLGRILGALCYWDRGQRRRAARHGVGKTTDPPRNRNVRAVPLAVPATRGRPGAVRHRDGGSERLAIRTVPRVALLRGARARGCEGGRKASAWTGTPATQRENACWGYRAGKRKTPPALLRWRG
jgi:hypothetical protein